MKTHKPIAPRVVRDGPVLQNIMRDPESNWVNCGTYRAMVQGPDRVGLWMSPGK